MFPFTNINPLRSCLSTPFHSLSSYFFLFSSVSCISFPVFLNNDVKINAKIQPKLPMLNFCFASIKQNFPVVIQTTLLPSLLLSLFPCLLLSVVIVLHSAVLAPHVHHKAAQMLDNPELLNHKKKLLHNICSGQCCWCWTNFCGSLMLNVGYLFGVCHYGKTDRQMDDVIFQCDWKGKAEVRFSSFLGIIVPQSKLRQVVT